jgi:hypothetical protein
VKLFPIKFKICVLNCLLLLYSAVCVFKVFFFYCTYLYHVKVLEHIHDCKCKVFVMGFSETFFFFFRANTLGFVASGEGIGWKLFMFVLLCFVLFCVWVCIYTHFYRFFLSYTICWWVCLSSAPPSSFPILFLSGSTHFLSTIRKEQASKRNNQTWKYKI